MTAKTIKNSISFKAVKPMVVNTGSEISRKIKTAEVITKTMYKYIEWCSKHDMRPSKAGFAIAMNFSSPDVILAWCKKNDGKKSRYQTALRRAYCIMEDILCSVMTAGGNKNGNGMFRYMQNAYGYRDKVDQNTNTTSRVIRLPARATKGTEVDRTQRKKLSRNKSQTTTGSGKKS